MKLDRLCMVNILQQKCSSGFHFETDCLWFVIESIFLLYFSKFFVCLCSNWKCKSKWNAIILTSAILFNEGAAINTTYGVNSEVRRIFRAWGSTSKIAIFPSLWMRRMVSNLVPYIASSCVPITKKNIKQLQIKHRQLRLTKSKPIGNGQFSSVYLKCHVQFFPVKQKCTQIYTTKYVPYSKYSLAAMSAIISSCDTK